LVPIRLYPIKSDGKHSVENEIRPVKIGGEFFQARGGSLGVGIPGAIGIKLYAPEKTVICFTGDGGSIYTIQALYTAVRYNVGIKIVICNNHSYQLLKDNIVKYWQNEKIEKHPFPDCFLLKIISTMLICQSQWELPE
jgi:benzoylformate decarboxylase